MSSNNFKKQLAKILLIVKADLQIILACFIVDSFEHNLDLAEQSREKFCRLCDTSIFFAEKKRIMYGTLNGAKISFLTYQMIFQDQQFKTFQYIKTI